MKVVQWPVPGRLRVVLDGTVSQRNDRIDLKKFRFLNPLALLSIVELPVVCT